MILQGKVINLDKLLKATFAIEGGKPVLNATLGGTGKTVPLTDDEWKQFAFILNRTGLVELEGADDIVGDAVKLPTVIQEQAQALEALRNQLSAAQGQVTQLQGVNATLEAKTAELEGNLGTSKEDTNSADATIADLREVIAGLQTKVQDLTDKLNEATTALSQATIIEDGGVATATVTDASTPVAETREAVTEAPPPPPTTEEQKT